MDSVPFVARHLGSSDAQVAEMLHSIGHSSLDALIDATVPASIRSSKAMSLPEPVSEQAALAELRTKLSSGPKLCQSLLGQGYYGTHTPLIIQRNVLENPGWYTAYTPYQAEISQGRLEAILNFQTMIAELTDLDVANASLLDEGTAAAEAMHLALSSAKPGASVFVSDSCWPQTLDVVRTRMEALGVAVLTGDHRSFDFAQSGPVAAVLVQYPTQTGEVPCYSEFFAKAKAAGALSICAADLLAITLLKPPGEFGADVCVGSAQRFGVPLGGGGPHAGYMAVKDEHKRKLPGRLVGVSIDSHGAPALRLSLQTREQHIRRDKATSNICTAQVLLSVMASLYAVYHGPEGLRRIARRVNALALSFQVAAGDAAICKIVFDTVTLKVANAESARQAARAAGYDIRVIDSQHVSVAFDETCSEATVESLAKALGLGPVPAQAPASPLRLRDSAFCTHPVFNSYHTEHEMLRYLRRLESKDIALNQSMIPLGSCTMKLNATAEMVPLSWPEISLRHPFAPSEDLAPLTAMTRELEGWLAEITGFADVSIQPNAGSQGEYAGLLAIRAYHLSRNEPQRTVCLIPTSAHGTNPASAVMAGFQVVAVKCDASGNIDTADLAAQAEKYSATLGALMITYPSTHGVYEEGVREMCALIHQHGGQVYMDGANMNAQVGLTSPGLIGADVCHLNLHKTFCIPHGGGGPGVGPVCVAAHLVPFLPGRGTVGAVSAAPLGSASICTISWMYIRMMGDAGLTLATKHAILAANYVSKRLEEAFPTLYRGKNGTVAHECILDLREAQKSSGVTVEDVAKRLIDYGFHSPTMSWPVPGTLMVEPTESESKVELDRFCDALLAIREEISQIETGQADRQDNPLKHAPHTAATVTSDTWSRSYKREQAAYPVSWLRESKYWPPVGRIDNVYGDKNLVCSCVGMEAYGRE